MTLVSVCGAPEDAILKMAVPPAGVLRNYIVPDSIQSRHCVVESVWTDDVTSCILPSQPQLTERHKLVRSGLRAHPSRLVAPHIL